MSFFDTVKKLADSQGLTMAELERRLEISTNSTYTWKSKVPKFEIVNKVADYFNVTTDFLYGRTDDKDPYWKLNKNDEKDIAKEIEKIINGLDDGKGAEINFYGEPMSDEEKRLFTQSLESALRMAKEESKKKFTPKKYRE